MRRIFLSILFFLELIDPQLCCLKEEPEHLMSKERLSAHKGGIHRHILCREICKPFYLRKSLTPDVYTFTKALCMKYSF
jgi:hypothetical protein